MNSNSILDGIASLLTRLIMGCVVAFIVFIFLLFEGPVFISSDSFNKYIYIGIPLAAGLLTVVVGRALLNGIVYLFREWFDYHL